MSQHLVLVGGSRGLGKCFAEIATGNGYVVSTLSRNPSYENPGRHYCCDITQLQATEVALESLVRDQGAIDGLVFFQRFRGTGDAWEGEIQTSITATRQVTELATPLFREAAPGSIVFVSSMNAEFISPQLPCGYHVAKAAICQMARYYACQLGSRGIRVNAVCPSTFLKPENQDFYEKNPELSQRLAQTSPLNRMGTFAEVANVIFFLLSENASFITGQSLIVDGGISLRWPEHP